MELSPVKRLAATSDRKLCNDLPITNLIRILNKDRLLIARDHIQERILRELNTVIQVERFENLPTSQRDRIKKLLLHELEKCSLKLSEPLQDIGIDRLVSLLHGISGNLPNLESDGTVTDQTDTDNLVSSVASIVETPPSVSQR